jgi:hypothetical protein
MRMAACREVAQAYTKRSGTPIFPLDVSTLAPESILCLVLEIWASEMLDSLPVIEQEKFFAHLDVINWSEEERESLVDWLDWEKHPEYVLAFYRTWLLLIESLPMGNLTEAETIPTLKIREAHGNAAATRHWYKTACDNKKCLIANEIAMPVRLPGHFSVRGDWYLAVAGGNRSLRLGMRALDLMSTRRANFRRMELGIGLPTRDLSADDSSSLVPIALGIRNAGGQVTAVPYSALTRLGSNRLAQGETKTYEFHWMWRSQLAGYHRQSRLIHSWLGQLVKEWNLPEHNPNRNWMDGFVGYDELTTVGINGQPEERRKEIVNVLGDPASHTNHVKNAGWKMFWRLCRQLREQMQIASET